MKTIILFCYSLLLFAACKKSDNRQYTTWHIIGKGDFSSNQVTIHYNTTHPSGSISMTSEQTNPGIGFDFYLSKYGGYYENSLPQTGNFILSRTVLNDGNYYIIPSFRYNSAYYELTTSTRKVIIGESFNNKAAYIIDTAWYYDYFNPSDSVQIYGTILEP